jgi:hypothetical protein
MSAIAIKRFFTKVQSSIEPLVSIPDQNHSLFQSRCKELEFSRLAGSAKARLTDNHLVLAELGYQIRVADRLLTFCEHSVQRGSDN